MSFNLVELGHQFFGIRKMFQLSEENFSSSDW